MTLDGLEIAVAVAPRILGIACVEFDQDRAQRPTVVVVDQHDDELSQVELRDLSAPGLIGSPGRARG